MELQRLNIMEIQIAPLIAPIGDSCVGEEPQNFSEYDVVVGKIETLDGIERVALNWEKIANSCTNLLIESTKDLKLANFLAFAWFNTSSFSGVAAGFELLDGLVNSEYASDIYPRRKKRQEKARAASFLWLSSKLEKYFQQQQITDIKQLENAEVAIQAFHKLNASLKEYLGEDAPLFNDLMTTFKRFQATIEENKESEKAVEETSEEQLAVNLETEAKTLTTSTPAKAAPATPPKASSPSDIAKVLMAAGASINSVAHQLKEQNVYSANAFFLNRIAKWILIQDLPPSGILDRQPNDQTLKTLQTMEASANHTEQLNLAEKEFTNGAIFCLSLHRFVHNALVGLEQSDSASIVLSTTQNFVSRFPTILDTEFKNGEPFVDELTKSWLDSHAESGSQSNSANLGVNEEENTQWLEAKEKANKLVGAGKTKDALSIFQNGIEGAKGLRESILWRYEMAEMLSKTGNDNMVVMQLRHVREELNNQKISSWQPELSINILKLMLACHKRIQQKMKYAPEMLEEINQLKQELVMLSPSEALAFVESQI